MATPDGYTFATVGDFVGHEFGMSPWLTVDQGTIDRFAESTGDDQWIHTDRERAAKESPYGTTIAHGFLVLSLLARLQFSAGVVPPDAVQALNFGLNRVRFVAPVRSGDRIRNRLELVSVEPKGEARLLLTTHNTIEVDGKDKPAMVADLLALLTGPAAAGRDGGR